MESLFPNWEYNVAMGYTVYIVPWIEITVLYSILLNSILYNGIDGTRHAYSSQWQPYKDHFISMHNLQIYNFTLTI